jgi:predicted Zn-dependent peptidase
LVLGLTLRIREQYKITDENAQVKEKRKVVRNTGKKSVPAKRQRMSASSSKSLTRRSAKPRLLDYVRPEELAPVDVNAGSRDEYLDQAGIAHFIEHMVFKGTAGRSMREIMRSVESRGGLLNAFTTKEHTCYYAWTRTTYLGEASAILFELATRPKFTEKDIEREKLVVIEEINGIEDEADELAFDYFEKELFGKHPLGRPIIGTENSVAAFDRDDLLKFHSAHYKAHNLVIVASGAHKHEDLRAAVDAAMQHVAEGVIARAPKSHPFPKKPAPHRKHEREGGQQAHIILGRRAPGVQSRQHAAINALITAMGAGMSSRLNLRLREELGLAYDATAFYSSFNDIGSVGMYIATAIENYDRTREELWKIVRGLFTRPISRPELERTKEQLIGGLLLSLESVSNRMMRTGSQVLYYDRYVTLEEELLKIAELTVDDVNSVAESLFKKESDLTLVAVAPSKEE